MNEELDRIASSMYMGNERDDEARKEEPSYR